MCSSDLTSPAVPWHGPVSTLWRACHRCKRRRPSAGQLLRLDTKKLARFDQPGHRVTGGRSRHTSGAGWQALHVAIDEHSRVGFSLMPPDETAQSACQHLLAALRYYKAPGVKAQRVMTDNGPACKSRRFAKLLRRLKIKHQNRNRPPPSAPGQCAAVDRKSVV